MAIEKIDYIHSLGFKAENDKKQNRISVFSETIPDLNTVKNLILAMKFSEEIHYWDADWKSPTDPGGYVTALCLDNNSVAYMVGNHGWTSKWYIVSVDEIAKSVQKNWNKDCDRGMYLNRIIIKPNKKITRETIYENLQKL